VSTKPDNEVRQRAQQNAECGLSSATDPGASQLSRMGASYQEIESVQRLLADVESRCRHLDTSTIRVVRTWLVLARDEVHHMNPAVHVIDACRRLGSGSCQSAWWKPIDGHSEDKSPENNHVTRLRIPDGSAPNAHAVRPHSKT